MKIERILLHYKSGDKMDRIYVERVEDLSRFDLSKVSVMEVRSTMTVEEFDLKFRGVNQGIASTGTFPNIVQVTDKGVTR